MSRPLYCDYQATTPLLPEVFEAMRPYLQEMFGNPHSGQHRWGWEARAGVDVARSQIAHLIGAREDEIVFTSGATEANNLALRGCLESAAPTRRRFVTLATEHACVLETARALAARGYGLTIVPVARDGVVDLPTLAHALGEDVALVSAMLVHNEIGVIQPVAEIAALAHQCGAVMHCDAAQAVGKIPVQVEALGVDMLSVSAHKLYGPKGVGALYVKQGTALVPQITGGGQEHGVRSGTLSPALCVGFGAACARAAPLLVDEHARYVRYWHGLLARWAEAGLHVQINGSATQRFFGNMNVSFPGLDGARLLADLRGVALSSGAACASASGKPSYVLEALGVPPDVAQATIRLGFGWMTQDDDIHILAERFHQAVSQQKTTP